MPENSSKNWNKMCNTLKYNTDKTSEFHGMQTNSVAKLQTQVENSFI